MEPEREGIRKAVERVRREVKTITEEAFSTVHEFTELVRDAVPRPLRRRIRRRIDKVLRRRERE